MPTPLNPITLPALDKDIEPERFIESAFQLWLENYFTGTPFNTYDADGNTISKTFKEAIIDAQEAELPEASDKPFIHLSFADTQAKRTDYSQESRGQDLLWTVSTMVKVPASLTNTSQLQFSKTKYLLRETADAFVWLLNSHENSALQQIGVLDISHQSGPTITPPANGWQSRLIIFTCKTRREIPRPL